jgi:N-acetylmuramate 1-kinase
MNTIPPEHEALAILTQQQFPALAAHALRIDPILKGGSDRHFYRIASESAPTVRMVLMVYTLARRDNPKFVPATLRLAQHGVHVPEILAFDPDKLCVWMNDLGGQDLHSLREAPWELRRAGYEATLREGAKIHEISAAALSVADLEELEPAFDEALYEWEQDYFLGHFVVGHLERDTKSTAHEAAHRCLKKLRQTLAREPRVLVHRDFQSQNVLLRDGGAWLVDYQGLRPGLAEYDLASLLFDPYVLLAEPQRMELLQFYCGLRNLPLQPCLERLYLCAAQRLMQALGAYANLSRNMGKPHFKQHIPAALQNLALVCEREPSLTALRSLFV